ncbi:MAG: hypothetical protein Q4D62_14735 [Planctomycetia bacterium]|nr:hypothetical protein [Planctomycetia bacterium]
MNRRDFIQATSAGFLATLWLSGQETRGLEIPPQVFENLPVTPLTRGPKFHWGAYYDQLHFDPSDRFVVGNEVDFEGRSPTGEDVIRVGLIDTQNNNEWQEIGTSRAWNWQQGPMLQWIPGSTSYENAEVIWNDREGDHFIAHVFCPATGKRRTLPHPAYVVSPDGTFALFPDFARLNDTRPGYGYAGLPDPNADVLAPDNAGIWRMDLKTGETRLLFTFADIAAIMPEEGYSANAKHWFNHLLISPDSKRFLFLHRWRGEAEKSFWKTRLLTANAADGSEVYVLNPYNMTSHLVWRDPQHIIAFARQPSHGDRFYIFEDRTQNSTVVGSDIMKIDGHVSFLPHTDLRWILNDTYPDKQRFQHPFLFHLATETKIPLGKFHLPPEYKGEWRVDLHPRASRSGRKVLVDTAHLGGRQICMIDLTPLEEWIQYRQ